MKRNNNNNSRWSGFTLVELLVVIGIIATLIAILLSAMAKARLQAQYISCASNLRQFGIILTMYANSNRGVIPLAYQQNDHTDNALMHLSNHTYAFPAGAIYYTELGQAVVLSGVLGPAGNTRALFCPLQVNANFQYNTSQNPWPPALAKDSNIGFGVRPVVNTYQDTNPGQLDAGGVPWQKVTKYKSSTAIAADIIPYLPFGHYNSCYAIGHIANGLNVCFLDSSVQWVPYGVYKKEYANGVSENTSSTWSDFDKFHG